MMLDKSVGDCLLLWGLSGTMDITMMTLTHEGFFAHFSLNPLWIVNLHSLNTTLFFRELIS